MGHSHACSFTSCLRLQNRVVIRWKLHLTAEVKSCNRIHMAHRLKYLLYGALQKACHLCSKDSQLFVGRKQGKKAIQLQTQALFFFQQEKKDDSGERGNETLTKKPSNIPCWNEELLWTSDCCVPLIFSLLNKSKLFPMLVSLLYVRWTGGNLTLQFTGFQISI